MRTLRVTLATGAVLFATLAAGATVAHHHSHHRFAAKRHVTRQIAGNDRGVPQPESSAPYYRNSQEPAPLPYVPKDDSASSIVLRKTIQEQGAPGLATELSPDAKETATGGPAGGLPSQGGK